MHDIYLGGSPDPKWRNDFVKAIGEDSGISVYDPIYDQKSEKFDVIKDFEEMSDSKIIVFLINNSKKEHSILQLGDAIGKGKQTIIGIISPIDEEQKIRQYCEYRGALVVNSLEDLVLATEEMIGQTELCETYNQLLPTK